MRMYELKLRKKTGNVVTTFVMAKSAEAAIEKAERVCGGKVRSCWPCEWIK